MPGIQQGRKRILKVNSDKPTNHFHTNKTQQRGNRTNRTNIHLDLTHTLGAKKQRKLRKKHAKNPRHELLKFLRSHARKWNHQLDRAGGSAQYSPRTKSGCAFALALMRAEYVEK